MSDAHNQHQEDPVEHPVGHQAADEAPEAVKRMVPPRRAQSEGAQIESLPGPVKRTRRLKVTGSQMRQPRGSRRVTAETLKYETTMRLDWGAASLLKLHAFRRHISMSLLVADILNGWLAIATDYKQQVVKELLPGARHTPVPERYAGYTASLGFPKAVVQATQAQDEVAFPAEPFAQVREALLRSEARFVEPTKAVQRAQPTAPLTEVPAPDQWFRGEDDEEDPGA